jgi:N-acetylglucosamine-6-phosphate deacetylase
MMTSYYAQKIISKKGIIDEAYLIVDDGKITGIEKKPTKKGDIVTFRDSIMAPGFIDIHTHGALGYKLGSGSTDGLLSWSQFELKKGVIGFLPSISCVSFEQLGKAVQDIQQVMEKPFSNILGMHMEGPFFKKGKKIGAQNPEYVIGNFPQKYKDFIEENSDIIRYIAIDPQHDCAEEIVAYCIKKGIRVSAAHTEILYKDFLSKKNGYSCITHTFNGMVGLHHREPGLAYAGCMDKDLYAEIICDGFHVTYPMLALFFKLKGFEKAVLITDAILATGMPPGPFYSQSNIKITVDEEGKVFKANGGLAGSTLTMDRAVWNIVNNLNIPLEKAVQMASLIPAKLLGIADKKGSLAEGKDADFIVLNTELKVIATYIKGKNVYKGDAE